MHLDELNFYLHVPCDCRHQSLPFKCTVCTLSFFSAANVNIPEGIINARINISQDTLSTYKFKWLCWLHFPSESETWHIQGEQHLEKQDLFLCLGFCYSVWKIISGEKIITSIYGRLTKCHALYIHDLVLSSQWPQEVSYQWGRSQGTDLAQAYTARLELIGSGSQT